jgi:DNA-directed RNA polymerase specialized sigma24 family protein
MTPQQIATLSGVNVTTVRDHTAGDFLTLRRTTAEKLLAVRPSQQPTDGWVSSLGAIRRCRALYTLGHGAKAIAAAHPDLQLRTVEYIIRGKRQHLTVAVHNTICEAYRKLCRVAGTSSQAKLRAATEGWHGPLAWDDIDNPTAKPETGRKTRAKAGIRKVHADRARVAELTAAGRSAQQIADELGCHKRTVVRARRKTDMGVAA